ncbi:MAG: Ada metal-binding domain-containing protein, partial [Acidimicrobiales bacterium]
MESSAAHTASSSTAATAKQGTTSPSAQVSAEGPTLDHGACYEAVRRRDARFDGRFYTAVTSTGVFCRPSCPARTPRAANVRFYA